MEHMEEIRQDIALIKQHITGNGGKGLLQRLDKTEHDIDFIEGNMVDKSDCRRMRASDYELFDVQFSEIKTQLAQLHKDRMSEKEHKILRWGIIAASLFSALGILLQVVKL